MGLLIAKDFAGTGITLNYWRINAVTTDIEINKTQVRVGGYISKADALAGHKSIQSVSVTWIGSDNPIGLMTNPLDYQTLLYAKLVVSTVAFLGSNYFEGAEIVSDLPD